MDTHARGARDGPRAHHAEGPVIPVPVKLVIDAVALVAYVIVSLPSLTGVAPHEWLGLAVAVVLIVHLAQHLGHVVSSVRRAASPGPARAVRAGRAVLAVLLGIALAVCVTSGVMVSGAVLPTLGLYAEGYYFWNPLHAVSAKVLLALLLIHLFINVRPALGIWKNRKSHRG
nr:DUF4405 domain-containing protein [Enterorhabdus sp. P55]